MQQNHRWGVNCHAGCKHSSHRVRNPSLHFRVHNSATVFTFTLPSCLCEIPFNIILTSWYCFFSFILPSGGHIPTKKGLVNFYLFNTHLSVRKKNDAIWYSNGDKKNAHTCIHVSCIINIVWLLPVSATLAATVREVRCDRWMYQDITGFCETTCWSKSLS